MLARFPGKCVVCGADIIPRQSEVEIHPTIRGPKGGKKVCHAECLTRSNPFPSVRRNSMVSVRRNSDCGCAYGADCGCGGYKTNPRKRSDQHYALMEQVKSPYSSKAQAEAADIADLRMRFEAERRGGGRGRRSRG